MVAQPYALAREEGQALSFMGIPTRLLATAEQTGGAFGLIEHVIIPAGEDSASPWHVHHAEDEAFYVVEGQMTFLCGEQKVEAGPGTFVYGPREIPHGFRAGRRRPSPRPLRGRSRRRPPRPLQAR
jgi:quercetin dioxygenase-like cupin family protein